MKMHIQCITVLLCAGWLGATSITSAQNETADQQQQQQQQELDATQQVLKASGMDLVTGLSAPGERTRRGAEAVKDMFVFNETNLQAWPIAPPEMYSFPVSLDGEVVTVVGQRHSLLAPDFKLLVDRGNGVIEEADPGPVRTYRGNILGEPESRVSFTLGPDGISAMIVRGDHEWYIEPIGVVGPQQTARHALYDKRNAAPLPAGFCGVGPEQVVGPMDDHRPADGPRGGDDENNASRGGDGDDDASRGQPTNNGYYKTQIAFDSDYEWFVRHDSLHLNAAIEILTILNNVNNIYASQLQICYEVSNIIIRSDPNDPYTSTNKDILLCEFRNFWNANYNNITYDVAHLMTDKDIDGAFIGLATTGGIRLNNGTCEIFNSWSGCGGGPVSESNYGFSQYITELGRRTELMAHEVGHNWNACHCNDSSCNPNADGDCGIMTDHIELFSWRTTFNGFSVNQILARRNEVACVLNACDCAVPLTVSDQLSIAYWTSHSPCGSVVSITPGTYQGPDVAVLYRIQQGHVILDAPSGGVIIAGP